MNIDLFCRVIDNYGDIGVCSRLARQLANEHAAHVRLIVDDLNAFAVIAPQIDAKLDRQSFIGVEVIVWEASCSLAPASVVIEAFACDPPDVYIQAMAANATKPLWINLEYLTAEAWVDDVHGLPSPHPRLPLTKYFFCPGFSEKSGGLIREKTLNHMLALAPPVLGADLSADAKPRLFAFCYPHAPVRALATALNAEVTTASPLNERAPNWQHAQPVAQTEFDALLAPFDFLIVRGEDSFLRAQFAAKPLIWHIYPTADDAHLIKLDAWLDHYCHGLNTNTANTYRAASHAFNRGESDAGVYKMLVAHLPALAAHARTWRAALFAQDDLATRLLRFIALQQNATKP